MDLETGKTVGPIPPSDFSVQGRLFEGPKVAAAPEELTLVSPEGPKALPSAEQATLFRGRAEAPDAPLFKQKPLGPRIEVDPIRGATDLKKAGAIIEQLAVPLSRAPCSPGGPSSAAVASPRASLSSAPGL